MGKAAATNTTTTIDPVEVKLDQASVFATKQQFITTALNMGWQLAVTVLIPVAIGSWLDSRYHSSPSYALTGLFIAIGASVVIITRTFKEVKVEIKKVKKKRTENV